MTRVASCIEENLAFRVDCRVVGVATTRKEEAVAALAVAGGVAAATVAMRTAPLLAAVLPLPPISLLS